jgi:replicative DNA helicase
MPAATATVTTQPHSLEAEKTVLGALLLDPEAITKVAGSLRPDDFYDPLYKRVYEACLQIYEARAPVDLVTVSEALASDQAINRLGGTAFLVNLAQAVPTASHVTNYATIVKDKARRRSLIRAGQTITGLGFQSEEFPAMLEQSHTALLAVADAASETKAESLKAIAERRYEQIAEMHASGDTQALRRVFTGFSNIDFYFNGFAPGSLTVIAARPSMGKTALATIIALTAATKAKKRVLIFSLEMTKDEVIDRITASSIGVPTWKMEKGDMTDDQVRQIGLVIDGFTECPLYVDDDPDTTLSNLRAKAIRHQMENGLDLLIVDYLQLIEIPKGMATRENRVQEISIISRGLKQLARELSIPVIALSQLNRAVENRVGNIPQLSDLRDSGSIEQDAHNVLMLWREGYYNEDCANPDLTTIFIRKNRQGPPGIAELVFNKELMRFSPLHPESSTHA